MKLYIYETETMEVVAIAIGENNLECEKKAAERYNDTDIYGWTYAPAFGSKDGLVENTEVEKI